MGKSQKQNKFRKSRRKQQKSRKTHKKQQKIRKTQKGGFFPYGVSNSFNELFKNLDSGSHVVYDVLLYFKATKTALRHYGSNNSIGKESKQKPMKLLGIKENKQSSKYIKGYLITFDEIPHNGNVSYKIHSIYELDEITIKKVDNDNVVSNKDKIKFNNNTTTITTSIPQDDKLLNNGIILKVKYKNGIRTMNLNNITIVPQVEKETSHSPKPFEAVDF